MQPKTFQSGRRQFFTTAVATGAGVLTARAQNKAPTNDSPSPSSMERNPSVYHFKIGSADAWSISDASIDLREGLDLMWPQDQREEMKTVLTREGRQRELKAGLPLYVNVLIVKKGKEVAIFDAGFGGEEREHMGWLRSGMVRAGIAPDEVTAAFLSHSHSDHLNGFVRNGQPAFRNAAFYLLPDELSFWRGSNPDFSRSKRDRGPLPEMVKTVRRNFDILSENMQTIKPGTTLLNGLVTIEAAPGHTTGHACFRIRSDGEEFLHLSDLAHHDLLMFADPTWTIAFDHEPEQAVITRQKYWQEAAAEGTRCYGFHLPWPGIGRILEVGEKYRWLPEPWSW
jgi:glyoxylase-like metal-dependent hydrolase (beta-lactamase superfamily II)